RDGPDVALGVAQPPVSDSRPVWRPRRLDRVLPGADVDRSPLAGFHIDRLELAPSVVTRMRAVGWGSRVNYLPSVGRPGRVESLVRQAPQIAAVGIHQEDAAAVPLRPKSDARSVRRKSGHPV